MKKMETVNNFKMTDCGRYGKAGEMNVKIYLNGERGNSRKVSAKGKTDVQYHGYKIEIKSNCGELDGIEKNDFVIYTMDNKNDYDKPEKWRIIPAENFKAMFETLGLVRTKKSSNGAIKTTIQSYKNSKRKSEMLFNALSNYPTLEQWVNQ